MENEYILMKQVAEGNEQAFECIFEKHRNKLYNYLFRVTKSKNLAEELVIDVFVKLWMRRDLVPQIKNLDAFLHKVAHNKALDCFRILARHKNLQKMVANQVETNADNSAEARMLNKEYNEIFYRMLSELSPQRRMVFALSRVQGLTHEEIANHLQLSRNTVRNTIAETLKHVRRYLHDYEIETFLN